MRKVDKLQRFKNWRDGIIIAVGAITVWSGFIAGEVSLLMALFLSVTTGLGKAADVLTDRIQDIVEARSERRERKLREDEDREELIEAHASDDHDTLVPGHIRKRETE